jgi:three-Cys-motif partner protein
MTGTVDFFKEKKGWSLLKDMILDDYLKPYISKVLRLYKPLHIIDCLAGKGRFDDGKEGSPLIIAKHIAAVLENQNSYPNKSIYGYFIEKKHAADLKKNLKTYENCGVLEGSYETHMEMLLNNNIQDISIFLYIDPYGIKSLDFGYFQKLKEKRYSSLELLINLNSFGFLREGCRVLKYEIFVKEDEEMPEDESEGIKKLNQIAGGTYWQDILEEKYATKISMNEAEEKFVHSYSEKLRSVFKYVVDIPIKAKSPHIPKYRLIFGTNHPDGLILMADEMNKAWRKFIEMERMATIQASLDELYEFPDMRILRGYDPEKDIENILTKNKGMDLKKIYVNMILKYGISYSKKEYEEMLKTMEKDGLIEVLRDPPTTRTGKKATSWDYNKNTRIRLKNDTLQN